MGQVTNKELNYYQEEEEEMMQQDIYEKDEETLD